MTATLEKDRLASGVGDALRARARLFRFIRRFFDERGFVEVDTPVRVQSPGTDVYIQPLPSGDAWLSPSPELQMKRLVVGGMPKIYQLAHAFRSEERGAWHEAEFLMLEWYAAFATVENMMSETESLVTSAILEIAGSPSLVVPGRSAPIDITPPFARCTVRDAFQRFAGVDDAVALAEEDEDEYFQLFVDRVEPALAAFDVPVFLHEYPTTQAALARPKPTDPRVAERFELYLAGVELCNGFGELADPLVQRARFESDLRRRAALDLPALPVDEPFLKALAEGLPPCAGNALGVDRLLALCLGKRSIAEVIPFPAAWLGGEPDWS